MASLISAAESEPVVSRSLKMRQRHFGHHQKATQGKQVRRRGGCRAVVSDRKIQIATSNCQGRRQPTKNAGKRRYDQSNQQRDGLRAQFLNSWKACGGQNAKEP